MNKDISLYYSVELDKIREAHHAIIENLRKDLINMGEQGFLYGGLSTVPICDINDGIEESVCRADKIKVDSDNVIKFHDIDNNEWFPLSILNNEEIDDIIEYIDWNWNKQTE